MIDLRLGDCLEVMKTIPNNSIDLVFTSPPYNLGNNHHTGNKRHNPYNDDLPEQEYQEKQVAVLAELFRVTKDSGSLIYNHKNRIKDGFSITPYQWLLKTNWILKQELVWFNHSQNFDKCRFYPMTERVFWLAKYPETKLFNTINHHDLFNWQPEGTNKKHTRAFPLKMVHSILQCFPSAKTILDPFMGSGTVGVACKEFDLNFIGIEISPEYFKLAEERINNTQAELFAGK